MRLMLSVMFVSLFVVGCGGGKSGGGGGNPDAAIDSPGQQPDAPPAGLTGLGQKCGQGLPACPANAPDCVGFTQGKTFCTPACVTNGTGKTNAQGQFPQTGAGSINPAPNQGTCTAAFTGTGGQPACGAIVAITPMDNPLKPNTNYTGIQLDCVVACMNNACPTGMTCNTAAGGVCEPN